jgi:AraC-like DNA-binding protein
LNQDSRVRSLTQFDFTDASFFSEQLNQLTESVGEYEVIQTGPPRSIGSFFQLDAETLKFQRLDLNVPWIRNIQANGEWFTVVIPVCTGAKPIFNGIKVGSTQVAFYGPGASRLEILEKNTVGKYFKISIHAERTYSEYLHAFRTAAPDFTGISEILDLPTEPEAFVQSVEELAAKATASVKGMSLSVDLVDAMTNIVLQALKIVVDLKVRRGVMLAGVAGRHHEDALQRCWKFIRAQFHRNISTEELAEASGYSERQLQYLFKYRLGISPLEYVRHYRMQKARDALKDWAASVKEAALSCGITELGRFSAKYRSVFGEGPNETLSARLTTQLSV